MQGKENNTCAELRGLVKRFPGVTAVNHVNLKVKDREVFALLGPSGCGKTSILRIIAGLETANEGEVFIGGKVINEVPPYRRDCNLVFQNLALFHPERINVVSSTTQLEADNKFTGKISSMIYQGDFVEIDVHLQESKNDRTITAHMDAKLCHENELSVGKDVIAYWDRGSSKIFQQ